MLESPGTSFTEKSREIEWSRKRSIDDDSKPEVKRPRYNWYFKLESESSIASEEDTESIYSIQDKETDVARDTSDTDTKSELTDTDVEIEVEYDVASLSSNDDNNPFADGSSSGSEDILVAAAGAIAAVIHDNSLEAWVTDCEDSDNSSLDDVERSWTDFWTCVQCKSQNNNPLFRYCEKCFQGCWQCKKRKTFKGFPLCSKCYKERKNFFPPRPRGHRPRRKKQQRNQQKPTVKLDNLRSCLNGLSQDSGVGSSVEMPLDLDVHKIVVPKHLTDGLKSSSSKEGTSYSSSLATDSGESLNTSSTSKLLESSESSALSSTSKTCPSTVTTDSGESISSKLLEIPSKQHTVSGESVSSKLLEIPSKQHTVSSPESSLQSTITSLSDQSIIDSSVFNNKSSVNVTSNNLSPKLRKRKYDSSTDTDDGIGTKVKRVRTIKKSTSNSDKSDSITSDVKSTNSEVDIDNPHSDSKDSAPGTTSKLPEYKELCIVCNNSPKNSIFLHGSIAHMCCCYKCAMRTWSTSKRCPVCNCKVKNVVKVFTT